MRACPSGGTLEPVSTAEAYVAALDEALVGPARVRRDLVREARDHLEDASGALHRAGYDRAAAERRAVADFGSLDEVVPAFQTTLAVASSRRTAWMLFAVLAVQPFLWDGPLGPDEPNPDGPLYALLDVGVEYGGGLMILVSLGLILATGLGNRWFAFGRRIARTAAVATIAAAGSLGLTGIAMVLLSGGTRLAPWLVLAGCLLAPLAATAASARRTLETC